MKNLFSIKYEEDHKIIDILGLKIKLKSNIATIHSKLSNIEKKISMLDNIWQINDVKFFVPYYPVDFIQRNVVNNNSFFESDILEKLETYIPQNSIILDIGANIGNHSLYWSTISKKNVSKIYAFEPVYDTFMILSRNIKINNLENKVIIHNVGLSDIESCAKISSYSRENIGSTRLVSDSGSIQLQKLDNIHIPEEHIDFIKIDVEGMEINCIEGAINTIKKFKPLIFIEIMPENLKTINKILSELEYTIVQEFKNKNYLFKHK